LILPEDASLPSDRFLAAIVESSDDAIITKTLEGMITSWNRGAELLYGHTAEEAVGRPISLIIPPDLPDELPSIMERLRRGERIDHYETVRVRKDGARRDVSVSISPIRDDDGRIVGAASIGRDVSEHKRAERERRELERLAQLELAARRESEERFRAIWEATSEALALSDPDGIVLDVNPAYEALYGFSREEVVGRAFSAIFPEEARAWAEEQYRTVFTTPNVLPGYESRVRRADGVERVVEARAGFVERGGERVAMVSAIHDVTARRAAEAALRESEARLQALVEQLPVGVGLADADGRWLVANVAMRQFVGNTIPSRDPERLRHWRTWDADGREVPPEGWPGARALRGEAVPGMEFLIDDGDSFWVRFGATPFHDADGDVVGVVGVVEDIDARKRAAEERVAFVDAAAHDLRNPLTMVKGQVQLLRRRARRGEPVEAGALAQRLAAIEEAATRMAALLDEMLDAAHLQAGRALDLHRDPTDLVILAEAAAAEARRSGTRHRIRVDATAPTLVGDWDGDRLERVLANLVGNAVKYSPDVGEVVLGVEQDEDPSGTWAVMTVGDQGIGIPAADLPRLFERFHRGRNVGGIRGAGIGLAGAKQIIEQHGGTIEATSTEGQGSIFTVRLPLGARSQAENG
jgi:PAS domain S-box-containing protein